MKHRTAIAALILACTTTVFATQWPFISLADLLKNADLVVVGSIDSAIGRTRPETPEASLAYEWNSHLTIDTVLKVTTDVTQIAVQWDEIRMGGVPDYKTRQKRIWILKTLMTDGRTKTCWTSGRPDTVLTTNRIEEVTMLLKKEASSQAIEAVGGPRPPQPHR